MCFNYSLRVIALLFLQIIDVQADCLLVVVNRSRADGRRPLLRLSRRRWNRLAPHDGTALPRLSHRAAACPAACLVLLLQECWTHLEEAKQDT